MKKLISLFALLAFAAASFGADIKIRDLPVTIVLPASNTYLIADGATQLTGKFALASVPIVTSTRTTLAALSVTGISTGVTVQTLGGSAIADGSSTLYYYNSASSATPNGTTVIQPTVGSGRWLSVASSNLPTPSVSTLGGVFSKAGVAHQYLSALDTAGNFTLSTVSLADIVGIGTIASQNSNSVSITGGAISGASLDGTLGFNTPAAATVTAFLAQTTAVVGTGAASSTRAVVINGGTTSNTGSMIEFQQGGATGHKIGTDGPITGLGLTDLAIMAKSGSVIRFYVNASSTSVGNVSSGGFNGGIGQNSPNLGSFTTLTSFGTITAAGISNFGMSGGTYAINARGGSGLAALAIQDSSNANKEWRVASQDSGSFKVIETSVLERLIIDSGGVSSMRLSTGGLTVVGGISQTGVFNVRTYGAKGDGATNDTSSIVSAKNAAATAHGTLYFPPGTYMTDLITVTGAVGLTIAGDGKGVSVIKTRTPSQVLNVSGSNHINVSGLTFDGSCTTRTAGQQGVVFDASQSSFCDNEIINAGEYAFFAGSSSTQISDLIVSRNLVRACYADGINFQYVTRSIINDNVVDGSDDDCIALGYNGTGVSSFITVVGNNLRARTDLGTTWGRGILVERATDCLVEGNTVNTIKQTGIFVNGAGGRASRNRIIGNSVTNAAVNSGSSIAAYETTDCTFIDNVIDQQATGASCFDIADWQNLTIEGGSITQRASYFQRGIHADEGSGWATSWDNLRIKRVAINMLGAATNSSIYLNPISPFVMNTVLVDGNTCLQVAGGDYITMGNSPRTGTLAKIVNNTSMASGTPRTINQTTGGIWTVVNNN